MGRSRDASEHARVQEPLGRLVAEHGPQVVVDELELELRVDTQAVDDTGHVLGEGPEPALAHREVALCEFLVGDVARPHHVGPLPFPDHPRGRDAVAPVRPLGHRELAVAVDEPHQLLDLRPWPGVEQPHADHCGDEPSGQPRRLLVGIDDAVVPGVDDDHGVVEQVDRRTGTAHGPADDPDLAGEVERHGGREQPCEEVDPEQEHAGGLEERVQSDGSDTETADDERPEPLHDDHLPHTTVTGVSMPAVPLPATDEQRSVHRLGHDALRETAGDVDTRREAHVGGLLVGQTGVAGGGDELVIEVLDRGLVQRPDLVPHR